MPRPLAKDASDPDRSRRTLLAGCRVGPVVVCGVRVSDARCVCAAATVPLRGHMHARLRERSGMSISRRRVRAVAAAFRFRAPAYRTVERLCTYGSRMLPVSWTSFLTLVHADYLSSHRLSLPVTCPHVHVCSCGARCSQPHRVQSSAPFQMNYTSPSLVILLAMNDASCLSACLSPWEPPGAHRPVASNHHGHA